MTTVRSKAKGDQILAKHGNLPAGKLSYDVVSDIAADGAFDKVSVLEALRADGDTSRWTHCGLQAVQSDPPFDYVIHTASPFHFKFTDPVEGILNPAINGTTGILKAIKAFAPSVKRVVITSSFAAIVNLVEPPAVYDESSWNPVTWDVAVADRAQTYRGSKVGPWIPYEAATEND